MRDASSTCRTTGGADGRQVPRDPETWGILGGLGPLASAEFLRTIYRRCDRDREQEHPRVILHSDPTCPDRTDCLSRGEGATLAAWLSRSIDTMAALGCSRVVICCVTAHAVLPLLPEPRRYRVRSLVDLVLSSLMTADGPHLMLCTRGCRAAGVFQQHPQWGQAAHRIVWPDDASQELIHDAIYGLKRGDPPTRHAAVIRSCLRRSGVTRYVAGCTELHLLAEVMPDVTGLRYADICVDPVMLAADEIVFGGHVDARQDRH